MSKAISQIVKYLFLFTVMGTIYVVVELVWRGYSHYSMFILAGICGIEIGLINEILKWCIPIWMQSLIGAVISLTGEFIFGCIFNLWLGMRIWDYSDMPFNILGQVCLPFGIAWIFLSCIAIVLDDYLRFWFFKEEKPHYCLWFHGCD